MEALQTYLPRSLVQRFYYDPRPVNHMDTRALTPACVVFADVSGFTRLAEEFCNRGDHAAEELTRHLNQYFDEMITIITRHGGDIIRFAGDAMLFMWEPGFDTPDAAIDSLVQMGTQCAMDLAASLNDYEVIPGLRLRLHMGVGAGKVMKLHVGGHNDRLEFLVAGEPILQISNALNLAAPGQVVLSPQAHAWVADNSVGNVLENGYFLLTALNYFSKPASAKPMRIPASIHGMLKRYVPATVVRRLEAGYSRELLSEMRRVSVMFVSLPGLDYSTSRSVKSAQSAVVAIQRILDDTDGGLRQFMMDDKGCVLIAAYGLPTQSHEDDPLRCVVAAGRIKTALTSMGIGVSIGITTGTAFCGGVGNGVRWEFALVADIVNLSARLSHVSSSDIITDLTTMEETQSVISYACLRPVKVKGKAEPVEIFLFVGEEATASNASHQREPPKTVIGRRQEMNDLIALYERARDDSASLFVSVEAKTGQGKSSLIHHFVEDTAGDAIVLQVHLNASHESKVYNFWREALRNIICHVLLSAGVLDGCSLSPDQCRDHVRLVTSRIPVLAELKIDFCEILSALQVPVRSSGASASSGADVWMPSHSGTSRLRTSTLGASFLAGRRHEASSPVSRGSHASSMASSPGTSPSVGPTSAPVTPQITPGAIDIGTAATGAVRNRYVPITPPAPPLRRAMSFVAHDLSQSTGRTMSDDATIQKRSQLRRQPTQLGFGALSRTAAGDPPSKPSSAAGTPPHSGRRRKARRVQVGMEARESGDKFYETLRVALVGLLTYLTSGREAVKDSLDPERSPGDAPRITVTRQPLVIVVDDAHYMDELSWKLLLAVHKAVKPLLVVTTMSGPLPSTHPSFTVYEHLLRTEHAKQMVLGPISNSDMLLLASDMLSVDSISQPVADFVLHRGQGNILFVQQLLRSLLDSGVLIIANPTPDQSEAVFSSVTDVSSLRLPTSLQSLMASRVDRLGLSQQLLLKICSCIGADFDRDTIFPLVRRLQQFAQLNVGEQMEENVVTELDRMIEHGFVEQSGGPAYSFSSYSMWEVVYNQMLLSHRQHIHAEIARILEDRLDDDEDSVDQSILADHWKRAGRLKRAFGHFFDAGNRAFRSSAHNLTVKALSNALQCVQEEPESASQEAASDAESEDIFSDSGDSADSIDNLSFSPADRKVSRNLRLLMLRRLRGTAFIMIGRTHDGIKEQIEGIQALGYDYPVLGRLDRLLSTNTPQDSTPKCSIGVIEDVSRYMPRVLYAITFSPFVSGLEARMRSEVGQTLVSMAEFLYWSSNFNARDVFDLSCEAIILLLRVKPFPHPQLVRAYMYAAFGAQALHYPTLAEILCLRIRWLASLPGALESGAFAFSRRIYFLRYLGMGRLTLALGTTALSRLIPNGENDPRARVDVFDVPRRASITSVVYFYQGRYLEALEQGRITAEYALKVESHMLDISGRAMQALCLLRLGRLEEAEELLEGLEPGKKRIDTAVSLSIAGASATIALRRKKCDVAMPLLKTATEWLTARTWGVHPTFVRGLSVVCYAILEVWENVMERGETEAAAQIFEILKRCRPLADELGEAFPLARPLQKVVGGRYLLRADGGVHHAQARELLMGARDAAAQMDLAYEEGIAYAFLCRCKCTTEKERAEFSSKARKIFEWMGAEHEIQHLEHKS